MAVPSDDGMTFFLALLVLNDLIDQIVEIDV